MLLSECKIGRSVATREGVEPTVNFGVITGVECGIILVSSEELTPTYTKGFMPGELIPRVLVSAGGRIHGYDALGEGTLG